ncbi:MAG: YihY/virulence factor BrkB family protein [Halothece sp.]
MALIYQVLPDAKVRFYDAVMGGTFTGLLFVLGQFIFGIFLRNADIGSAYGVAKSLIIVIVWVYYSAHIVLFGAEFTQVYARRFGDPIVPAEHAIHVPTYYDHRSQEEKDSENLLASIRQRCIDLWRRLKR